MAESQPQTARGYKLSALSQRLIVASLIVLVGCSLIAVGGYPYLILVLIVVVLAVLEYVKMYQAGGFRPSAFFLVIASIGLVLARYYLDFQFTPLFFTLIALLAISLEVFDYRQGGKTAALDFSINIGGLIYVAWLGSYFISLRTLPDGMWWTMLVIPATGFVDGGAYLFGSLFGKHKMAPLISPKKSWEGYLGGVLAGLLTGAGLAALWHLRAPTIEAWHGLLIGAIVGLLTPIGDLGESVLKRGFGVKDTSDILPGHGGVLDRIDSWLWAAPISYYIITWLINFK